MDRFAYFTLRLRLQDPPIPATGVIEDLTTGEKREFTGVEELIELLGAGLSGSSKMRPGTGVGQTSGVVAGPEVPE
ncbi:MAG TPA: hypothetical protein VFT04_09670 [Gemmatimonadales bacterium]|nr:hypothetical protein [Gemmatimonadales bacterium]